MKIEATGVNATPPRPTNGAGEKSANLAPEKTALRPQSGTQSGRVNDSSADSLTLSAPLSEPSSTTAIGSGDYSAKMRRRRLPGARVQSELHTMSELKNKADERLKQFGSEGDTVESVSELKLDDDRQDMVEIAKLRVKSGFYDRPDVADEIARRIIEGF